MERAAAGAATGSRAAGWGADAFLQFCKDAKLLARRRLTSGVADELRREAVQEARSSSAHRTFLALFAVPAAAGADDAGGRSVLARAQRRQARQALTQRIAARTS